MTRLGIVIHRYGTGISGGAEVHCRLVAQRLARLLPQGQVEILTTTAKDYLTWANAYPAGEEQDGPLLVRRFPTRWRRNLVLFDVLNRLVTPLNGHAPIFLEKMWFLAQGPRCPGLLEYLSAHANDYDRLIFYTYLYEPTVFGLPLAADQGVRTWLIPTAHDEPPLRLKHLRPVFKKVGALGFLSPAEERLVRSRFDVGSKPSVIIGAGVEPPRHVDPGLFRGKYGLNRYILYLGRVDIQKGVAQLLEYWAKSDDNKITLVLAGERKMAVPEQPRLLLPGYLSEAEKWSALAGALAVVAPSPFESLNLTVLEAGAVGRPVLVNGQCQVLADYVARSGGGVAYLDLSTFQAALELLARQGRADELGRANFDHVQREGQWSQVDRRLLRWLELE